MTDHVTPEGARRHAKALDVLGTHPHLESARQLRSLAAQLEAAQKALLVAWKYTAAVVAAPEVGP